jgi:prophage antirepressor-like protein
MDHLKIFSYQEASIRTIIKDQEVWFVAKDVAETLGYSDTAQAIRKHCKCAELFKVVDSTGLPFEISPYGITIIPERDIYRLVMRSRLPQAEAFEEWVVGEVLPSIRKSGGYFPMPQSFSEALYLAAQQQKKIEEQQLLIDVQQPKAELHDQIMETENTHNIGAVAKMFGMGQNTLFNILRREKVLMLFPTGSPRRNMPYQKFIDEGLFEVKIVKIANLRESCTKTTITPKGIQWVYKKLIEWGELPKNYQLCVAC